MSERKLHIQDQLKEGLMRDTHRNEVDEVDKKFIGTTRFLSKLHFKITDKAKFLYGEFHLRLHLMKSDFECIGIYIPCQSHRRNFFLMFYRELVNALISSHHQALSRNKGTEIPVPLVWRPPFIPPSYRYTSCILVPGQSLIMARNYSRN
jgi:hypothetical protein